LPPSILRAAVAAVRAGDTVVLGPALDGGYTLIGLSRTHARVFADIPWSTPDVFPRTVERAGEIGVLVTQVPGWYDVDDQASLRILETELACGRLPPPLRGTAGALAPATRAFLERHLALLRKGAA